MKRYTFILILVFCSAVASAQNGADSAIAKIPFKLFNNHIYLNVRVNNSKPLWFILDTGAGDIIDLKHAKALNLELFPLEKTYGVGDASEDVSLTKNILLHI